MANQNGWSKSWNPVKGKDGWRMRWYNIGENRVRLEFRTAEGLKAKREFPTHRAAQEVWEDFKRGAVSVLEMRAAGFI